jgi:PBP1b-binding outer membrane lipoprotein LpoB
MKKALLIAMAALTLVGCSSMKPVPERKNYAQPKWYQNCVQSGKEGYLWWTKDMVYACGAGESRFAQAAEEQMYAIAMNNFAKRINSEVNSSTVIKFDNDKKSTQTMISYQVRNTTIREHLQQESGNFTMAGKHYTFVRLKMPKNVFDSLIAEASQQ